MSSRPDIRPDIRQDIRQGFGERLKAVRLGLAQTQDGFARLLGIHPARYSKYEIGRSEAPYDVLIKIAKLAGVSLDYLVIGEEHAPSAPAPSPEAHLIAALAHLPAAAAIYDRDDRLLGCNDAFRQSFFPENPEVVRPGVTRNFLVRAWAYAQGIDPLTAEAYVRDRREHPMQENTSMRVQLGGRPFHLMETQYPEYKFVLTAAADDSSGADAASTISIAGDAAIEVVDSGAADSGNPIGPASQSERT